MPPASPSVPAALLPSALSAVAHTVPTTASDLAPDQWGIDSTWCTNISSNAAYQPCVNIFACAYTVYASLVRGSDCCID